jgi:DnaJ domain
MDLGSDPGAYIEYPGGNSFHVKESFLGRVQGMAERFSEDELESLLMPFMDPHIRRIVERFERPKESAKPWRSLSSDEVLEQQKELHSFDKRRFHYLRFGRVQMGDLDRRPFRFLQVLTEKSRDEIEAMMEQMELILKPHERRTYVYTAFHLQNHFHQLHTRNHPSALDPERVDEFFMEDMCRLNRDERFFNGVAPHDHQSLHPYLIKYLILYFDNDFVPGTFWNQTVKDFMWKHQFHRKTKPHATPAVSHEAACRCLEISLDDFKKMDRQKLTRCYRLLAKKTHPDRGGESDRFVEIKAAYEVLLQMK